VLLLFVSIARSFGHDARKCIKIATLSEGTHIPHTERQSIASNELIGQLQFLLLKCTLILVQHAASCFDIAVRLVWQEDVVVVSANARIDWSCVDDGNCTLKMVTVEAVGEMVVVLLLLLVGVVHEYQHCADDATWRVSVHAFAPALLHQTATFECVVQCRRQKERFAFHVIYNDPSQTWSEQNQKLAGNKLDLHHRAERTFSQSYQSHVVPVCTDCIR